jgi:hypothetical protein
MRGTDHCFTCWPGGPWVPPPCRVCLSTREYYSDGLCARCHYYGPQKPDSCVDCHAWGVYRNTGYLCYGCRMWRENAVAHGPCPTCADIRPLGRHGVCRLCRKQASMLRRPNFDLEVYWPNEHGQQLFLANLHYRRAARPVLPEPVSFGRPGVLEPVTHRQLVLFPMTRDLRHGRKRGYPPPRDAATAAQLEKTVAEYARTHGWGRFTLSTVTGAVRLLLGIQDTPGAPILASDVALIKAVRLPVRPTLDLLEAAGYLEHDDVPDIAVWAERLIAHLPEQMRTEIRVWIKITVEGRPRPPRRLPKSARTLRGRLRPTLPVLEALAAAGHQSLRTVARNEILDALPAGQTARKEAGYAMRQILQILKEERLIFANPLLNAQFPTNYNVTAPEHLNSIRTALSSPDPATAAAAALAAFHALPTRQIRALQITDLRDGYLHVPGGPIPLAEPARRRLAAYLDHRNARWPETANQHIFLTQRSAHRTSPVGAGYFSKVLGISTQRIRADRIMEEAAAGQDLRAMCDMFGITIETAQSYLALAVDPDQGAAEQARALGLH